LHSPSRFIFTWFDHDRIAIYRMTARITKSPVYRLLAKDQSYNRD